MARNLYDLENVTFTVEPRKTKTIAAGKITTYKANKN